MIKLGIPQKNVVEGQAKVTVPVRIDDHVSELWLSVDECYQNGLCCDRIDGFVVAFLSFALRFRHDITFEFPITSLLKEQIEKDFIDVLCQNEPQLHHVRLFGPVCDPIYKAETVRAMGLSCGVDCLYTVHNRMLHATKEDRYFVMTDAHLRSSKDTTEESDQRFQALYVNGKSFADKLGIPLIVVRTNWGHDVHPLLDIHKNTTFCNCFIALALQNMFSQYFLASGGPVCDFATRYLSVGAIATDCSNFDLLSLGAFSIPALRFVVDGLEKRIDKIKILLDWSDCWENLDVCEMHRRRRRGNDTYDCHKCMHTIVEILSVGGMAALEKFKKVFDVEYVRVHRDEYLAYQICQRIERSEVGLEAWNKQAFRGCSLRDWFCAMFWIVRKCLRKLKKRERHPLRWVDI